MEFDLGVLLGGDKEILSKAITKFGIVSIRCSEWSQLPLYSKSQALNPFTMFVDR